MAKTNAYIGFRVTSEFKERIEAQARKEHRPVANLIHKVVEEYLDRVEKEKEQEQE